MKNGKGDAVPAETPLPARKKHRKLKLFLLITGALFLLLCLTVIFCLTPYALRSIWLPFAANLTDAKMEAADLRIESFIPFRVEMKGFHYSDGSGTVIDVGTARTGIRLKKLLKGTVDLKDTYISDMKLVVRCQPSDTPSVTSALQKDSAVSSAVSAASSEPPLVMHVFKAENVTFLLKDSLDKLRQEWTVRSIQGNRLLPREKCVLSGEAELKTYPSPNAPFFINSLPFHMNAIFVLQDDYGVDSFHVDLKTGIMDLVFLNEYSFSAGMQLQLKMSADGKFLDDSTFILHSSELFLIKEKKNIGKLTLSGELGKNFQCKGKIQDFNAGPLISFLLQNKKSELTVRLAEFHFEGHDFSPESIQSEISGELKLQAEKLSFPVDLDSKSRLFRLIMIPLEALPTFFNLARLRLEFKKEVNACLSSINDAVSGKKNLEFNNATADIALDHGLLNVRDISLHGKDLELESIQGKLVIPTGSLDMKSLLIICGIKIPLNFEGTLSKPSVNFISAAREFFVLNASFLKTITEGASKIIPSDTIVEKVLRKGFQSLNLDNFLSE